MFCSFLLNFPSIKIPPSTGAEGQHICMVFEYLGDNLLILIKYSILTTVAWIFIWLRRFVITCWFWLDYLQRELSVVHSDLKPENVLVPSMIGPSKVPRKSGVTLVSLVIRIKQLSPMETSSTIKRKMCEEYY